jgi:hypothetical protein
MLNFNQDSLWGRTSTQALSENKLRAFPLREPTQLKTYSLRNNFSNATCVTAVEVFVLLASPRFNPLCRAVLHVI